jgi:hypothetical protein
MLFNTALEKTVRDAGIEKRGTIYHKSIQVLAYVDDIDIIGLTTGAAFLKLEKTAQETGLMANESKTKYMEITCKLNNMHHVQYLIVDNYKFEKVNEFKYLRTLTTANNNLTQEINHRLVLANKCYYGLKKTSGVPLPQSSNQM